LTRDFRQRINAAILNHHAKQILDFIRLIRTHDARKDVVELVIGKSGISLELTDLRVDGSFCKTRNCIKHRRHILCAGFTLLQGFHETYSVRARYRRKFRHS
jgi:hypothetical protein